MTTVTGDTNIEAASATGLRILIADKFAASGVADLEALGGAVTLDPGLTPETLPEAIRAADPDVLIVRSTKVPETVLEAAERLSLIVRAGAGYDNIDVTAASQRGVFVANCPGKNAIAVAEIAWAHILGCDRRVADQVIALRNGEWNKAAFTKNASGLFGRTLGVVGLGRIGQAVIERAHAFGMNVVAWSRSLTQEKADEIGVGYCSSLINLAKMSDVVSVNVAATPETDKLIGESFIAAMRDGATLVNTSRGIVVDEVALEKAVRERGLRAGLDVYRGQPGTPTAEFAPSIISAPGVYGTHHCGASTDQAQQAIADEVIRIIHAYRETGEVPNCVNLAAATPGTTLLTVRHLNRPGVLAHVFYTLGQAGINVEEMDNVIYSGNHAACARIQLSARPADEHVTAIAQNEHVLGIDVTTLED
ncbi:MAG: NAD(P)-dependent oxidoreductase [Planctomycetota bacterium]|jgi:D-3-phosphoglycerate dehydrogenase